ncbi:DUF541 domain-containing protein [Epibacterium sp. SM1969]|uniref:DUF541 domain-containing protein n=2 Tax=Tritonibacter aquimaris TaxID=2663379 RepID=A0A844ATN7_9RHOB|nr:DUF541 domain-containing protein [Tritonibacter aquimaris]
MGLKSIVLGAGIAVGQLYLPTVAAAQPVVAEAQRQIVVQGSASRAVAPDQAVLTLGVREEHEEARAAMAAASKAMVAIIDELVAAGIAAEDMQTSQLSLSPVWARDDRYDQNGTRKVVGFEASNMLTVKLRDLDALGGVLDQVLAVGANQFQGLRFGLEDANAIERDLRAAAVKDAYDKAQQLADAAGVTLGAARQISEHDFRPDGVMMEMARSAPVPIAAGSLEFSHQVSLVFDLEP